MFRPQDTHAGNWATREDGVRRQAVWGVRCFLARAFAGG
jgi:hypothetical protein